MSTTSTVSAASVADGGKGSAASAAQRAARRRVARVWAGRVGLAVLVIGDGSVSLAPRDSPQPAARGPRVEDFFDRALGFGVEKGLSEVIAVVGHPDLTAPTLAMLEEEPYWRLSEFARAGKAGLVRAGRGLPVTFGRAARAAGMALVTVLPSSNGVPEVLESSERRAAGELLLLSEQVRLLEYDPTDRGACVGADESLLRSCARLLAVWDGSPSSSKDATARLVAFARGSGMDVDVLWPEGAGRTAPDEETS